MAAFAREDANKVWQRVAQHLVSSSNALILEEVRRLKSYQAQHNSARQLQFLSFTAADAAAAGGTVLGSGVGSVIGIYVKKTATATQNTVKLYDDATDDTTAGNAIGAWDMRIASLECFETWPVGMLLATGLVVTAHTTVLGTTGGSAANAGGGFVILR